MDDLLELAPDSIALDQFDLIVDVRPPGIRTRWIAGSMTVPLDELTSSPATTIAARDSRVLIVCDAGARSLLGARRLRDSGYAGVRSLAGGIDAWAVAGRDLETQPELSPSQIDRYDRHIKLPEIGVEGQRRILDATVTVVGAGGLGVPALMYLAGSGVGSLRVIEPDTIEVSNLHRQPLYAAESAGESKAERIVETLRRLNSDIHIEGIAESITPDNAAQLLSGSDVVIDATDRFDARYAISDACQALATPLVLGAVFRWEGQLAVFPAGGPCYRCLFPTAPEGVTLDCAITGVLGPVVGVIGSMQATEALKIASGIGTSLAGTLLTYDGRTHETHRVSIARRADCGGCGR